MSELIFVTGTDTGVGKTVITASLVRQWRLAGLSALACKPICSGGREDAVRLVAAQQDALTLDECNPFYFKAALAPAVAARREGRRVRLDQVVAHVTKLRARCDLLLVEGAGGILVPAGHAFTMLDLLRALRCRAVVIVAANRLGTINHTSLTYAVLRERLGQRLHVEVLLNQPCRSPDLSGKDNEAILRELLPAAEVSALPYLGRNPFGLQGFRRGQKKFKKVLARILDSANFAARQTGRTKISSKTC